MTKTTQPNSRRVHPALRSRMYLVRPWATWQRMCNSWAQEQASMEQRACPSGYKEYRAKAFRQRARHFWATNRRNSWSRRVHDNRFPQNAVWSNQDLIDNIMSFL